MGDPQVTVLLPAYNEEQAIAKVIEDVRKAMDSTSYEYEILVVNDQSTDKTEEAAKAAGVRVITRPVRGGSGSTRKTGIQNARGEIVVMLDADGSYEAGDIPRLLEHIPEYDQVNGARTSEKGTLRMLRAPAKWFLRQLASYLTKTRIPDLNTGLKAFKKDIMLKYLWVLPAGFSCVTTMTMAFLSNGYAVKYVPTTYHKRIGKSKFHPISDTLAFFGTIIRMIMYFNPLRIFLPLAILLVFAGIAKGIHSLHTTASLQESDIIIMTAAFLVGALGLIADVIVAYHRR